MRRYYPLAELTRLEDTFDKFIDRFFSDFFPTRWEKEEGLHGVEWAPAVDLIEKEDHFLLRLEIPGIKKDDIDISVTDDTVTIKGDVKKEKREKDETYYLAETCCGSFGRSIKFPHEIDPSKVEATLKDGVLELKLPKKEIEKAKVIEVKVK
ncbi:Hsp20/alpha crystallin family protein [candidate division WOR-3 bacterium]|nr:Hsp20/alpha crystallin family protein [candidate division WOR-3 bacterium]MCK4328649.1 Hsp20/alpha crystallin family protein [candidate division WOR-3 bacterium]